MSLDHYRQAVLGRARTRASAVIDEARTTASGLVERTLIEADTAVARARSEGEVSVTDAVEAVRLQARRARRARILAAQCELALQAQAEAVDAALALRGDRGYPLLLERLTALVRGQLGEDAELEIDPAGAGGVRGRRGRSSVDYTLPALARRCLGAKGEAVEGLWR